MGAYIITHSLIGKKKKNKAKQTHTNKKNQNQRGENNIYFLQIAYTK